MAVETSNRTEHVELGSICRKGRVSWRCLVGDLVCKTSAGAVCFAISIVPVSNAPSPSSSSPKSPADRLPPTTRLATRSSVRPPPGPSSEANLPSSSQGGLRQCGLLRTAEGTSLRAYLELDFHDSISSHPTIYSVYIAAQQTFSSGRPALTHWLPSTANRILFAKLDPPQEPPAGDAAPELAPDHAPVHVHSSSTTSTATMMDGMDAAYQAPVTSLEAHDGGLAPATPLEAHDGQAPVKSLDALDVHDSQAPVTPLEGSNDRHNTFGSVENSPHATANNGYIHQQSHLIDSALRSSSRQQDDDSALRSTPPVSGPSLSRPASGLSNPVHQAHNDPRSASSEPPNGRNHVVIKVGMVGDAQIGKTSLMVKYVEGSWDEDYIQTLGVNFMEKTISIRNTEITFSIWDLGGQREFVNMLPLVCNDAVAILFMFDLTRKSTLNSIKEWYRQGRGFNKTAIPILVGTKYDHFVNFPAQDQEEISNQARRFAKAMRASLIFSSTSHSINVQKIFKIVLSKAFDLKCTIPEIENVGEPLLLYQSV
ncbi:related to septum initiation protein sid3 [Claviceps purpurea 20.1]|uniref:Related to septum initiation protein sid3 n=1 Tax=Claviceps purpurea (strain 20.1) TaxID=1111077 RepID=M1VY48_CLAP2|nr:related to septum initiation protein sid3 [Claviceps purpurea 20.1]